MGKAKNKVSVKNILIVLFLSISALIFLFPLIVTFTNSFMSEREIGLHYTEQLSVFDLVDGIKEKRPSFQLIPDEVTLSQYKAVLIDQPAFLSLLANSAKITFPIVILNLLLSLLSSYGFTVWKFKYKEALFFIYIVVMLMPLQASLVPNYIIAEKLKLTDSYFAIILPGIFSPFGAFLLRQGMKSLPKAYFEAAEIDGAGRFYILTRIVLPQLRSSLAALTILNFIEYWNLVEQSIIFIKDYYREPLSVFLSRLSGGRIGLIFAISCVYMLIPFLLLLYGQKDLEKGIELSGIK